MTKFILGMWNGGHTRQGPGGDKERETQCHGSFRNIYYFNDKKIKRAISFCFQEERGRPLGHMEPR